MKLSVTLHQKINLFIFFNIILFNIEINAGITDLKILNQFESTCLKFSYEENKAKKKFNTDEIYTLCSCITNKVANSKYTNEDDLNNSPQHTKEVRENGEKWAKECVIENNLGK